MARIGQRVIAALQQRLFDHLIHADLGYLVARGTRAADLAPDLRHPAAAPRGHHGADHRGARPADHARPGRP